MSWYPEIKKKTPGSGMSSNPGALMKKRPISHKRVSLFHVVDFAVGA